MEGPPHPGYPTKDSEEMLKLTLNMRSYSAEKCTTMKGDNNRCYWTYDIPRRKVRLGTTPY
jgi:hypothetical protein